MDWILAGIVGWCGTGWPRRFPGGGGGGGGFDPDNPWPPNCPMCSGFLGIIGGIVTYAVLGQHFASAGMLGTVALAFFGGSFAADVVNTVAMQMGGKKG